MESALVPYASSALSTLLGGQASSAITPVATQALTGAATQGLNSLVGTQLPKIQASKVELPDNLLNLRDSYNGYVGFKNQNIGNYDTFGDELNHRDPLAIAQTGYDYQLKQTLGNAYEPTMTRLKNYSRLGTSQQYDAAKKELSNWIQTPESNAVVEASRQLYPAGTQVWRAPNSSDGLSYSLTKEGAQKAFNGTTGKVVPYTIKESDRIIAPEFVERANSGAPQEEIIISPQVQQYLGGQGGVGTFSQDINRVGSSEVAPVNKETLPVGWDTLEKYLSTSNKRVENAIGKSTSKITKQDLIKFNSEMGYDTEGTKGELWRAAQDAIDDQVLDDLYMEGSSAADIIATRKGRSDLGRVEDLYLGAKGRTGRLDAELSDRLGIGRSNTPMLDRLNKTSGGAMGDYGAGAIGSDPLWATGEYGVNTVGHERLHAFQEHAGLRDYDPAVSDAFYDLEDELIPLLHNESQIKAAHPTGDVKYWGRRDEQEARMFQDYLEYKNYTQKHFGGKRKYEYGEEIVKPFDKFIKKLQELSKKGIALPALGLLFGGATVAAGAGANRES